MLPRRFMAAAGAVAAVLVACGLSAPVGRAQEQPVYQKVTADWVAKSPGNAELLGKVRELLTRVRTK